MSNKTQLQQNNIDLARIVDETVKLEGHGQFVWKKMNAETKELIGHVLSNDETAYPDGAVHTDGYWYERDSGKHVWEKREIGVTEPIGYVISDDPNKYPEGGEREGKYYKKVNTNIAEIFGYSKIEYGSFVPTSLVYSVELPHTLGVIPKKVIVINAEEDYSTKHYTINNLIASTLANGDGGKSIGGTASYMPTSTAYNHGFFAYGTELELNKVLLKVLGARMAPSGASAYPYFSVGKTYHWIALA